MTPEPQPPAGELRLAVGLSLLALLAWTLPPCVDSMARSRTPAPKAVYGLRGRLLWSPCEALPAQTSADGKTIGADGRPAAALGGWPGLLLGNPLDLNRATLEDLDALPRVGPKTAEAILEARRVLGAFRSEEDLLRVPGIGPKTLERLRPLISL